MIERHLARIEANTNNRFWRVWRETLAERRAPPTAQGSANVSIDD
jgi:hypothetical protein